MPAALALSPHLDDAAFSAGGTLARLAGAGWRVSMATVFTASVPDPRGFALACQLDKGLPTEADYMRLRRAEDEAAAAALGVAVRHLPFREAPHRGYGSAPELFSDVRADDAIVPALTDALVGLIADIRPDLILAPQAVGGHVDHVQVVRALRAVPFRPSVLWWRDFPYTIRSDTPKEPLRDTFSDLAPVALGFDAACAERKRAACAAYATQIGFQFGGADALAARLGEEGGIERFRLDGRLPEGLSPAVADADRG